MLVSNKSLKWLKWVILFCCIVFISRWAVLYGPYIFSFDSQHYTRLDRIPYEMFTPDEIKNAPGMTDKSIISYYPQDGTSSEGIQVEYDGRRDIKELEEYLLSLGYHEGYDPIVGKRWYSSGKFRRAYIIGGEGDTVLRFSR
ncbi:Uncharacterised protein [Oligella urethralis]|nr:Uncharacterised protein [Oligella urethralis]